MRDQILRACADAGFSPPIALETGEMSAARAFVSAGLGVTILPRSSLLSPGPDVHLVRLRPASLALAVRLDPRTAHGAESAFVKGMQCSQLIGASAPMAAAFAVIVLHARRSHG